MGEERVTDYNMIYHTILSGRVIDVRIGGLHPKTQSNIHPDAKPSDLPSLITIAWEKAEKQAYPQG